MKFKPKLTANSLKTILEVAVPFFKSERKRTAWGFLLTLLLLLVVVNGLNVAQSYIGRDFINALSERRAGDFYRQSAYYLLALAVATIIAVYYRYTEERLALAWREWMTARLVHLYFTGRNYYRLRAIPELDNPDQRIAEDVKNFTAVSLSLFLITLNSAITLVSFMGVLASISGLLVAVLFIYTIFGTGLTIKIGSRLVRIYNRQYAREATFRYNLVRIRENAESIAFFRGERREKVGIGHRFKDLVRNSRYLISWNRNLGMFTTGYSNFALVLPTLIIAPAFFAGGVQFGVVTQATAAFAQVLAAASVIITQFERISAYFAGTARLRNLWNELNAVRDDEEQEIHVEEGTRLKLTKTTIVPPKSDRELVKELSFTLKPGNGLLIMGPSGSGKSSVLRTIAGIWTEGQGAIERPSYREMMFLPQRPYMVPGSLRAQLLYPFRESGEQDKKLKKVLSQVNLSEVLERVGGKLDAKLDWSNVLSLGEQQRVSFARLFLMEPKIAFLDEGTSALDEDNELTLYSLLRKSGLTFVSVGHRSSLIQFHDFVLQLDGSGGWKLITAAEAASH